MQGLKLKMAEDNKQEGLTLYQQELELRERFMRDLRILREARINQPTPKEYVKTKPMGNKGMRYIPANYMDDTFKKSSPKYSNKFAFQPFFFQNWVIVGVELTDVAGNVELGLKAHRVQFNSDKKKAVQAGQLSVSDLTPFDMIDVGNDVSACLTEAIKNAQSRFGIGADIYQKQVLSAEDLEQLNKDFADFLKEIDNPMAKRKYQTEWDECKTPADKLVFLNLLTGDN